MFNALLRIFKKPNLTNQIAQVKDLPAVCNKNVINKNVITFEEAMELGWCEVLSVTDDGNLMLSSCNDATTIGGSQYMRNREYRKATPASKVEYANRVKHLLKNGGIILHKTDNFSPYEFFLFICEQHTVKQKFIAHLRTYKL